MEALEVYLLMLLVLQNVESLKELINIVFLNVSVLEIKPILFYKLFHWRTEKSVDFLEK